MVVKNFPDISTADDYGLVALGGDLEPESLILAYRSGIFPWPIYTDLEDPQPIPWFSPNPRAILLFKDFHQSQSLKRLINKNKFQLTMDKCTEKVIINCAVSANRKGQKETWITSELIEAYSELARMGYCHSVECWNGSELVGGLYGISIGNMFAGESMFFKETGASKLCLSFLVEQLKEKGSTWLDCQQLTPLLKSFGAKNIKREAFIKLLNSAIKEDSIF